MSRPLGLCRLLQSTEKQELWYCQLQGEAEMKDFKHYFSQLVISIHSYRNYLEERGVVA